MIKQFSVFAFHEIYQLQQVEQLKSIKFNVPLQSSFNEQLLGQSNQVEDVKTYRKGVLKASSIRIVWHSRSDVSNNINIGLETIYSADIKEILMPDYGSFKRLLTIKALSPSQVKYEFKFMGYKAKEVHLFAMLQQIIKQFAKTKHLRVITTTLKQVSLTSQEEVKSKYENCLFEINEEVRRMTVTLTNARIILITDMGNNYSIPWISISRLEKIDQQNGIGVKMKLRSIDSQVFIGIEKQSLARILQQEILSFAQTYSKHPFVGIDLQAFRGKQIIKLAQPLQIVQIEASKVDFSVLHRQYGDEGSKGTINSTFFNEQLGIMMEMLPKGQTRQKLWQILR